MTNIGIKSSQLSDIRAALLENTITENDIMIDSSLQSTEKSLADRLQSGNMVATA